MSRSSYCMDGLTYGYLTVLNRSEKKTKNGRYLCTCKCVCGRTTYIERQRLIKGTTKSCGCKKSELVSASRNKGYKTLNKRLYSIYTGMKDRCFNPNSKYRSGYGGRGITMCDEWKNNFELFRDWAHNNGYSDKLTIDRIDVNGDYEPSNCRWVDYYEQENNRRNTVYCLYNNELIPVMILSRKIGESRSKCISKYGGYKRE